MICRISIWCHRTSRHHTLSGHRKTKIGKKQREKLLLKIKRAEELIPAVIQQHDDSEIFLAFNACEQLESGQYGINVGCSSTDLMEQSQMHLTIHCCFLLHTNKEGKNSKLCRNINTNQHPERDIRWKCNDGRCIRWWGGRRSLQKKKNA